MYRIRNLIGSIALFCGACAPSPAQPPQVPQGVWTVHKVELPGRFTTHYLEAGDPDAPTVVLLHGFPDAPYGWRYVIPELASDYHVLAPTLRGYAGAGLPKDGYDLPTLADDLRAFLAATNSEQVHLIAHDWGAAIGWEAATNTPERFLSFTALDVPHPLAADAFFKTSKKQRRYRKFVRKMVMPGAATYIAGLKPEKRMQKFYLDRLQDSSKLRSQDATYYNAAYDDRADSWGPIRYYKTLVRDRRSMPDRYIAAGPVTVPTLVLWGKQDRNWLWPLAELSCEHVSSRCKHQTFDGAGHYLQWERPEAVVSAWRGFTESLSEDATSVPRSSLDPSPTTSSRSTSAAATPFSIDR